MGRAENKAARLLQIEAMLLAEPDGLSQAEIARRLSVNRSTIGRYLPDLPAHIYVDDLEDGRWRIDRDAYLVNVRLTLHEAMAVHLAARLMATRSDKQNPHAAAALRKLGVALEKLAPRVAEHLKLSARVMDDDAQRHDPVYLEVLETLTRAWSLKKKVWLKHQTAAGFVSEYTFSPYFIEPYAVGQTTHVIGWREPTNALRTFKLERIRAIRLLDEGYDIPPDFDPQALLANAWGIWYTEAEPVEVILRFHPRVAQRVLETQWHRDEKTDPQPDGSLEWRGLVAEPQEMLPWIRGWGADVQVLAPAALRDAMMSEARRLGALYGVADVPPAPVYELLWAKTSRDRTQTHPLICHLIDVAQVVLALWDGVLTGSVRAQFATALGLDPDSAGRLLAFWAGLHDLGKACPAFQRQYTPAEATLAAAGLPFPPRLLEEKAVHGTVSARALETLLATETALPARLAKRVARAVGGHHGIWPVSRDLLDLKDSQLGSAEWDGVRRELVHALISLLSPPAVTRLGIARREENALLALLSGLTSAADWLGSMEHYFPYEMQRLDLGGYAGRAAVQAGRALRELGWIGWEPPTGPASFRDLFRFEPRSMQQAVIDLAEKLDQPALVIIEAPTGLGKTEAALYLADHWAHLCRQRGLYVAMPTMATSNQMFGRVRDVLARRYPDRLVNLHLVHSQARWSDDMQQLQMQTTDERDGGTVAAMTWFLPHKRSLLAPFAVGTVDQALLSVLQTRHFFVRLFGLNHKTVIFDEVHAYDTYMSAIFHRLLGWLRAVGASVVILSATLPKATRRELVEAYLGGTDVPVPEGCYPAITWAAGDQWHTLPLEVTARRSVMLEWIGADPSHIAALLAERLRDGGCAAVICNTVRRAQDVYCAVKEAGIVSGDDLILFHARFPFAWRDDIERRVLSRFGKDGQRPYKAVVVATQVIEQSLDLDFDLMVSDLAPADLVLQRAGRLHRHERASRPASLSAPRLCLTMPADREGVPGFGRDVHVYEPYVLLRSYLTLSGREKLVLPDDTPALVEDVYGDEERLAGKLTARLAAALAAARDRAQRHRDEHVFKAQQKLVPGAEADDLLNMGNLALEEEQPELHQALQALTRLVPPGVSIVCLHRTSAGLKLEPDGSGPTVDLGEKPGPDLTKDLAQHTLSVTHPVLLPLLLRQAGPPGWKDHALLHSHRAIVFVDGACPVEGTAYTLRLSRELGLQIDEEEG